ncbi:SDR family oxidoreductase [Spirosoma utsteinense]|uniref:Nucleoside-diphosphate-sugar epimerase n=1 Tax=Spirosoma utsteinense TaxID=2585773 RepID=A0ABR6WE09_9BACT|nr:SDR family oxidoreductase [Spirosoma utsteinense]MBC3788746.1 nucleoside-diphosphate-sugar epimerase [Spirosoma utsteinense]MBC3794524.1 nucleoside-diphosphate-sugar epimerase [Spirosoma utsteinense]
MKQVALVVGASGITGSNLAHELIEQGWLTYGLARNPNQTIANLQPVAADLLDPDSMQAALATIDPTHVFFTSWMRNATEAENIRVNGAMVRNLLDALAPKKSVQHVALVTGLKHYLGPFDAYAKEGFLPLTPVREEHPRLEIENFYYAQEDEVYAAAARDGFTWSIHRPHTVIGKAVGNMMNLGSTLAAYATICQASGRPFRWPGSKAQWEGLSDVTDARVLAKHLVWAATTEAAHNEAFNVANGDVFRWSWLWKQLADWFGLEAVGFDGTIHPLEEQIAGDGPLWQEIASRYGLAESNLNRVASAWHTDLDLGRPIEVMTDMSKSRKLGFSVYQRTDESFFDLFEQMQADRLIPAHKTVIAE